MMRKLKFITLPLLFLFFTVLFLPKIQLYYLLEEKLNKERIVISKEKVIESLFSLEIKDSKLYKDRLYISNIEKIDLTSFLVYNKVIAQNIYIDSSLKQFLPLKIDLTNMVYSIFNPFEITGNSRGDFGKATFVFNLKTKVVKFLIRPSVLLKTKYRYILKQLKKKEEVYFYEYKL